MVMYYIGVKTYLPLFPGTLAVGYLDGQVHVICMDLEKLEKKPQSVCLQKDIDLLRISCMLFVEKVFFVNQE